MRDWGLLNGGVLAYCVGALGVNSHWAGVRGSGEGGENGKTQLK